MDFEEVEFGFDIEGSGRMGFLLEEAYELFEEGGGCKGVRGRKGEGNVGGNSRKGEGVELFAERSKDLGVESEEVGARLEWADVGAVGDKGVNRDCEGMI